MVFYAGDALNYILFFSFSFLWKICVCFTCTNSWIIVDINRFQHNILYCRSSLYIISLCYIAVLTSNCSNSEFSTVPDFQQKTSTMRFWKFHWLAPRVKCCLHCIFWTVPMQNISATMLRFCHLILILICFIFLPPRT